MIAAIVFAGVTLGAPVSHTIARRGPPTVVTTDVGTVWTWPAGAGTLRLTTDDDGTVQMIDAAPPPKSDPILTALAKLAPPVEFSATTTLPDNGAPALAQAYRLDPAHELALLYATRSHDLSEVFLGDRVAFARTGLLPDLSNTLAPFKAPVLEKLGSADYDTSDQGVAFVRIAVSDRGDATAATTYVSSGNPRLDRIAIASALHDQFTPAQRDGKPVASVYFRRVNFINTTKPR
jgi:hypothetical protein